MSYLLQQGQAAQPLVFLLVDASDHIGGLTGAAPTVTLSKNGGAFAAASGAVTELGNGWYAVAANATDTDTLGPLLLHATAAGADPLDDRYDVVAFDPQSATNLGLANLDATVSSRSTYAGGDTAGTTTLLGLLTVGRADNLDNLDATVSSRAAAATALSNATWTDVMAGFLDVAVSSRSTYAGGDTSGTTTLLGLLTVGRAAGLDNLDATISSRAEAATALTKTTWTDTKAGYLDAAISTRSTYAGGDTSGTTTLLERLTSGRADNLDNLDAAVSGRAAAATALSNATWTDARAAFLDAAVSSRSTYVGGDTAGTTTLLGRLTSGRAGNLDNLDAAVSTRLAATSYAAPPSTSAIASVVWSQATRTLTSGEPATATDVADAVLARSVAGVEGTMAEFSMGTVILALTHSVITNGTWKVMRTDGTTPHLTRAISGAAKIVNVTNGV